MNCWKRGWECFAQPKLAEQFMATQGDYFDTQNDMATALLGAGDCDVVQCMAELADAAVGELLSNARKTEPGVADS